MVYNIKKPLVSIITPVYNAEKYIAEAIDSVINQTWQNWELLIINDGSTDQTEKICKRYAEQDIRIKLTSTENRGVSAARNLGLDQARGEFITFLDADDVLPTQSLALRISYLAQHPAVDGVDGIIVVRDAMLRQEIRRYQPYYKGDWLPRLLALDNRAFFGICFFFRSKHLGKLHFKENLSHAEDLVFYIELSKKGFQYAYICDEVYICRKHEESAMKNLDGLYLGYIDLIKTANRLTIKRSLTTKILLKLKLAKIMLACRLNSNQILKSPRETLNLLFCRK